MAFDAFLKLDGIKGESTDSKHKDEVDVLSFSWGAHQTSSHATGTGSGSGKVDVQPFSFVHKIDKSSPILFQKCCTGEHIASGLFTVRKAGGTQLEYLKIKLSDVLISSIRPGGSSHGADDIPLEEVSLTFDKVEVDYQPQGPKGDAQGGPVHGGWDLKQNVKA
ncbi:MAG TPA: type VI secretion system tube protein Hcp [Candidatus Acidoferrales bacterium]|nr:type VI secretion system tube protein Hcp [Candidatus Acidoferrales bacterium]